MNTETPSAPTGATSPDLAALWRDLQVKNAAVAAETRRALRSRSGPPSRAPGSAYADARAAYRAFWDTPGADDFALVQKCGL